MKQETKVERNTRATGTICTVGVEEGQRAWSRDSAQGILGKSKGGRNAGQRTEAATRCGGVMVIETFLLADGGRERVREGKLG